MMRLFLITLAIALAFGTTACSKHDDSSSSATDAPTTASDAATAIASPEVSATAIASPDASATATPTATSAETSASASAGSTANTSQLARDGFPMYPNATLSSDELLDATVNNDHTMAASLTTSDDFGVVDAWYKSHLSSQYTPTHIKIGDVEESTYTLGSDTSLPHYSAIIARVKADSENKASTKIVIAIKEVAK